MRSTLLVMLLVFAPTVAIAQTPAPLTLHGVVGSALGASGTQTAAATVQSSQRAATGASASPQLSAGLVYGLAPQLPGPAQTSLTEQLGLDFSSPGTREGQLFLVRANAAQAQATLLQTRITVMQSASVAFFAVASDQAQLQAAYESVALGRRSLQAAQDRHRVGLAPLVDVERVRAALASAQADQAAATAALSGDRESLVSFIGASSGTAQLPSLAPLPALAQITALAPLASPPAVLALVQLDAAQASELLARGALQPVLSVGAGVSQLRQSGIGSNGPALNAGLTFPIASSIGRASIGVAHAQVASARAAYAALARDAIRNALALRAQAAAAAARLPALRTAFDEANRVAQSSLAGYRLGAVSSADLVAAQTQLAAARRALAVGMVDASRALALLNVTLGVEP